MFWVLGSGFWVVYGVSGLELCFWYLGWAWGLAGFGGPTPKSKIKGLASEYFMKQLGVFGAQSVFECWDFEHVF